MRIVISQQDNHTWIADRPALSGSPVIGKGKNWKEALGDLFLQDVDTYPKEVYVQDKQGKPYDFPREKNGR